MKVIHEREIDKIDSDNEGVEEIDAGTHIYIHIYIYMYINT
jgi:hypothetical protein